MTDGGIAVVPVDSQNITKEKLKKFLPRGSSVQVTDEIMQMIYNMENDTGLPQELMEENLMSYMHLIGRVSGVGINDLANAMKYCTLKRNMNNREAWAIVFPKKFDELIEAGKPVDNFVSMYNSSKLVTAIDKEMLIPVYLQYNAYRHKMIDVQYRIALGTDSNGNETSAMVQHLASKALLEMLALPEDKTIELRIGASDAVLASQQEMNNSLATLVANQSRMFASGMQPEDVQKVHTIAMIEEAIEWEADDK